MFPVHVHLSKEEFEIIFVVHVHLRIRGFVSRARASTLRGIRAYFFFVHVLVNIKLELTNCSSHTLNSDASRAGNVCNTRYSTRCIPWYFRWTLFLMRAFDKAKAKRYHSDQIRIITSAALSPYILRFTVWSTIVCFSDWTNDVFSRSFASNLWSVLVSKKTSRHVWNRNIIPWRVLERFYSLVAMQEEKEKNSLDRYAHLLVFSKHRNSWINIFRAHFPWNSLNICAPV